MPLRSGSGARRGASRSEFCRGAPRLSGDPGGASQEWVAHGTPVPDYGVGIGTVDPFEGRVRFRFDSGDSKGRSPMSQHAENDRSATGPIRHATGQSAYDQRSLGSVASDRKGACIPIGLQWRCTSTAPAVSPTRRAACGHPAVPQSWCSGSPLRGTFHLCLSGLHWLIPSRVRQSTIAAPRLHPTDLRQDKSREVRTGRMAEKCRDINAEARCAFWGRDVCFLKSWAITTFATPCAGCPYHQSHDRAARRTFRPFYWSTPRRMIAKSTKIGAGQA